MNLSELFESTSLLGIVDLADQSPWYVTTNLETLIGALLPDLPTGEYRITGNQAIHRAAMVEDGAQLKGALIIGPETFVAKGALLWGGVILDRGAVVGHQSEVKTSILWPQAKAAHFNFVGDSLIGSQTNIEAGAIVANHRTN